MHMIVLSSVVFHHQSRHPIYSVFDWFIPCTRGRWLFSEMFVGNKQINKQIPHPRGGLYYFEMVRAQGLLFPVMVWVELKDMGCLP